MTLEGETPQVPTSERFVVRFAATFGANAIQAGFSFVSGLLVARGLGASGYGDLSFLLGSFAAISQLLEMGTSSAFFTFISRKARGSKFFVLYGGWMTFQFVATVVIVGVLLPAGAINGIWVGHERGIVLLAFGASFLMTQTFGLVRQLGEAIRKTVFVQTVAIIPAVVHLAAISAAVFGGWLTVQAVMWLRVGEYALLVAAIGPRLMRANIAKQPEGDGDPSSVLKEFANYCAPLVAYAWVGFLYAFTDRWLLQHFGGAEQQGFFAIGRQFSNISLIATTSIVTVFWKEIAEARERSDQARLQKLYTSVSRSLYFGGAWISFLLIPYTAEILQLTVGPGYESAWIPLVLMFLYPIHQSLGQITGTFFYATGETASYAKIGLTMMGVSIPVTYLLLAPASAVVPGLGLGAVGLATKMVVLQIIGVNVLASVIAKHNNWTHEPGIAYQAGVLATLAALGILAKWLASLATASAQLLSVSVGTMLLGAIIYMLFSAVLVRTHLSLVGMTPEEMRTTLQRLARAVRSVSR